MAGFFTAKPRNVWFEDTFLPSFEEKMHDPKYPNRVILSDRQAEICIRYMDEQECKGDYGWHTTYEKKVGGTVWYLHTAGRYTFLSRHFVPYREHLGIGERIKMRRLDRREDREDFGMIIRRKACEHTDCAEDLKVI